MGSEELMPRISRRKFIKIIAGAAAGLALGGTGNHSEKIAKGQENDRVGFKGEDELPETNPESLTGWQDEEAPLVTAEAEGKKYFFQWNPRVRFGSYEASNNRRQTSPTILWLDNKNHQLSGERNLETTPYVFIYDGLLIKAGHWEQGIPKETGK